MAEIPTNERESMVSAIIHLGNKNFDALTDDFINLGFLPADVDRAVVTPVTQRILSPYVYGGGGANAFKNMSEDYSFQQVTQDLLTAQLEIPFAIPAYIALLARAIAILEGIALGVNPKYKLVMEAYPFVTRNILKDNREGTQQLLREVMYDSSGRIKP